jgi:cysteine desulfurase
MAANNELGCINDLKKIGTIAHKHKVPFHTDAVQLFGKYRIPVVASKIDAMSMSFHKLYGPMGLGLLILSNELIDGYGLQGQIAGSQQNALRGGTENVPSIAGAIPAIQCTFDRRMDKNRKMFNLKNLFLFELEKILPRGEYKNYFTKRKYDRPSRNEFIVMGPPTFGGYRTPNVLPNTVLISFIKNNLTSPEDKPFCNVLVKKCLNKHNIIVSVGSACSTSSAKASHVLYAIKAPAKIRQGVMRISLGDASTEKDIMTLIRELKKCLQAQMELP